jgi:hypoxanthine phosphoribosyltransferase
MISANDFFCNTNGMELIELNHLIDSQTIKISPENKDLLYRYAEASLTKGDYYCAIKIYKRLHDFSKLREVKDMISKNDKKNWCYDFLFLLHCLEDQTDIENHYNGLDQKGVDYASFFLKVKKPIFEKTSSLLAKKGRGPSGKVNSSDVCAIYQLAKEYDIGIAIANGGLYQGAIAALWGMPLKVLAISAHGRKNIKAGWLDEIKPENLAGKRVLLFDNDVVSGATVKTALEILKPFGVCHVGLYLSVRPTDDPDGIGTHLENIPAGIEVYYQGNVVLKDAGKVLAEFRQITKTGYGQRLTLEKQADTIEQKLRLENLELSLLWKNFIDQQLEIYDSLNNLLPGVDEVRQSIINRCNSLAELLSFSFAPTDKKSDVFKSISILPENITETLLLARYSQEAKKLACQRNVRCKHLPIYYSSAFQTAVSLPAKDYDYALIVGPEGFAYEPIFLELGIETLAINIPEYRANRKRKLSYLDQLPNLKGKRILIVEDDIRTGATLQKILTDPLISCALSFDLYLGQEEKYHLLANIPPTIKHTFVAGQCYGEKKPKTFTDHLESMGQSIFRNDKNFKAII